MKLATLKDGTRDGQLAVVSRDLNSAVLADGLAPTLQSALDDWAFIAPQLELLSDTLNAGKAARAFEFDPRRCMAPLPRAYQWVDGSSYLSHVQRVRQARGASMPPSFLSDPLMYQGGSDDFLGPCDGIVLVDPAWGLDFEAEIGVVTLDVPLQASPSLAASRIALVVLVNDLSLRNLIPGELAKGFGFLQSKPASAFAPIAVTPSELDGAWDGSRLKGHVRCEVNGALVGAPDAGEGMVFAFPELIAHLAKTRRLTAGSIIGGGTISNAAQEVGFACIAEQRAREAIEDGRAATAYLAVGDHIRISMIGMDGKSIFGAIEQEVIPFAER